MQIKHSSFEVLIGTLPLQQLRLSTFGIGMQNVPHNVVARPHKILLLHVNAEREKLGRQMTAQTMLQYSMS